MRSEASVTDERALGRPELVERIRREIGRNGPITFERFMELALYEPDLGYYATLKPRPDEFAASGAAQRRGPGERLVNGGSDRPSGALADFQTSPQVHPAFGYLLARELRRIWEMLGRPRPFVVAELGAGAGELARSILAGLADEAPGLAVIYHAIDLRAPREEGARPAPAAEVAPIWWPSLDALVESGARVHGVVSNEFFDALPVHRVAWVGGALREVYVDWAGGGFVERLGEPSLAVQIAWRAQQNQSRAEGWRGEVCERLRPILTALTHLIDRGVVLTIDYGYGLDDDAAPPGETLLAYHRHYWTDDLYRRIGEQDLTSHVDFGAFQRLGREVGLEPAGALSQRAFLLGLGLAADAETWAAREPTPGRQWQARFALAELVRADGLGRLGVVALQKGLPTYRLA